MPFRKNILTAAVLAGMTGGLSPFAQAGIVAAVCQVNDVDGCAGGSPLVTGSGILTLRGYAYDIETSDRPQPGGYIQIRNEDTLALYRLPIRRIEARPEILGPKLLGTIRPEQYSVVNAGFIAPVFMASLPPGSYAVVEARISMEKAGLVSVPLDAGNRATFRLDESNSPFRLVATDGTVVPLGLTRNSSGALRAAGYPPLRDGQYRIEAQLNAITGAVQSKVDFNYQRPVIDIPVSVPLVQDFPGVIPRIAPINPLTKRPIDREALPVIVDAVDSATVKVDGGLLQAGQSREIARQTGVSGVYRARLTDEMDSTGQQTVRLFVNLPDAPNIRLNVRRWNPADLISVTPSRPSVPIKVEDIDIDAKLAGGAADTCQTLTLVRPDFRLAQASAILCALRWAELPEGLKYNPYRANALRGSVPNLGDNAFSYTPGVVYTDPIEKTTQFYPAKTGDGYLLLQGTSPTTIAFTFRPHRSFEAFYASSGSQFPGKYFAQTDPNQERLAGLLNIKGGHRNVRSRVTYPDGSEREHYSAVQESNMAMVLHVDEPWKTYPVKVESWYERAPEFRTEETLEFVGIPLTPVVDLERELSSHDQTNTVVNGYMGIVKGQDVTFDPASMGRWQVWIVEKKSGKTEDKSALSPPVEIQSDGTFSVDLGQLSAGSRTIRVVAQMLDAAEGLVNHRIESKDRVLVTQRGNALEGSLSARQSSGKIPFRQTIYFSLRDSTLLRNVGSVRWEQEREDGTWQRIMRNGATEYTGMNYVAEVADAGKRRYRAIVTNRFSGSEFVTEPFELQAYNLPSFTVEAPAVTVVGKPVTLTVKPDSGLDADYTWSFVSSAKVEEASDSGGMTFTFTPKELKSYVIEVSARERGAPETAQSAVKKTVSLKAVNPLAARATLSGPTFVEAGKTYRFQARHNDVVSSSVDKSYEIKGYWSLPDGSRVDALELDYTVRPSDTGLSYYTYVDGYPEETSVAFHSMRTWVYRWPTDWRIQLSPISLDVPASIRYNIAPVNFDLRTLNGEPLTYTWSLPNGVIQRESGNTQGTLEISRHGTYQIAVQVADTRGNVVNVSSDQFSVLPAATVKAQANIVSKYGETYYAPGSYYVSLKVLEVPRGDRFLKNEVLINGQKVGEFVGSGTYVSFTQPGEYEVVLRTLTQRENYGENTLNVMVEAPPEPRCSVDSKMTASGPYLTPRCTVDVGYVRSYTWNYELDGQPQRSTSKAFVVMKAWLNEDRIRNLTLTVESDLGAQFKQDIPIPDLAQQTSP
ncbi:hypothetical protein [Allochromatium tepidum]|uniref:PKD domain-containing protein n=1 Tax=Allochromatium tepidum TaxID=553982 RepID=A0ABN6GEP7_9GAMM|nr:hypothetical protein [Allochromatium tepidum]BCU08426.1 hypothetical protein Atep_31030 [Allochromatium tepidum]